MNAQHTPGPYKRLALRCNASGQDYTSYGTRNRPDDTNNIECPGCGKRVKLMPKYRKAKGKPARCYIVLPYHNRPAGGSV